MRKVRLVNRLPARAEALYRSIPRPTDGKGWYRVRNLTNASSVEIYVYDEIGLWGVSAADFVRELQYIEAIHIDLRINSPGGDVWDGIAIYNALCNHPASVTSYVDGIAASAASFIAQAGGKVLIARNGTMMIHDAEGICIGNAADMAEMVELLDRTSNNIADIYAQRCSTVLQWRKAMKAVSWYVGQEAVDGGLADETYEPEQGSDGEPAERRRRNSARGGNQARPPRPVSTACPVHETGTTDEGPWNADDVVEGLGSSLPLTTARHVYAWYDSEQVEDGELPPDACKLPHHVVDENGTPGAAHLEGVRSALDGLDDSDIPESEREACRSHLQAHLDDAEVDDGVDDVDHSADFESWWKPETFKAAVATAADQHNLYGFDADTFREIMRAASENCPAAPEPVPVTVELPEVAPRIDTQEFLTALRKGLL